MRAHAPTLALLAALALPTSLVAAGCVIAPVDLRSRPCPCAQGWACVSGTCIPESELDAAAPGDDAGPRDGGAPLDAPSGDDASAPVDASVPPVDSGGGPVDAGPPDGGPGITRCDDAYAGAIFCDGFEFVYPGSRGAWDWELVTAGVGSLATVTTPPPRIGERALQASISASSGRAAIGATFSPPVVDGELWLRGWYYLPSDLTIAALSLLYVGAGDGSQGIAFQTASGEAAVWMGTIDTWRGTSVPIPRDEWACLRVHIVVAEPAGLVEIYLGETLIGSHPDVDTLPPGGFEDVEAGIEYSPSDQPAGTLYVDEVVLSRTRVECE